MILITMKQFLLNVLHQMAEETRGVKHKREERGPNTAGRGALLLARLVKRFFGNCARQQYMQKCRNTLLLRSMSTIATAENLSISQLA